MDLAPRSRWELRPASWAILWLSFAGLGFLPRSQRPEVWLVMLVFWGASAWPRRTPPLRLLAWMVLTLCTLGLRVPLPLLLDFEWVLVVLMCADPAWLQPPSASVYHVHIGNPSECTLSSWVQRFVHDEDRRRLVVLIPPTHRDGDGGGGGADRDGAGAGSQHVLLGEVDLGKGRIVHERIRADIVVRIVSLCGGWWRVLGWAGRAMPLSMRIVCFDVIPSAADAMRRKFDLWGIGGGV
jgi:hypothetical protein